MEGLSYLSRRRLVLGILCVAAAAFCLATSSSLVQTYDDSTSSLYQTNGAVRVIENTTAALSNRSGERLASTTSRDRIEDVTPPADDSPTVLPRLHPDNVTAWMEQTFHPPKTPGAFIPRQDGWKHSVESIDVWLPQLGSQTLWGQAHYKRKSR